MNVVDSPTSRKLEDRIEGPTAAIIHTTGDTDLAKVMRFYHAPDGLGPHYIIILDGTVYRLADESLVAYHAKIEATEARIYAAGYREWSRWLWDAKNKCPVDRGDEQPNYRTWRDTWMTAGKGIQSPLDLCTGNRPNGRSVGIELLAPTVPGKRIFTDLQYQALAELLADICQRQGIPPDRDHLLGHYDVSPMRRSTAAGGWDPGERFDWNGLFDLMALPRDA